MSYNKIKKLTIETEKNLDCNSEYYIQLFIANMKSIRTFFSQPYATLRSVTCEFSAIFEWPLKIYPCRSLEHLKSKLFQFALLRPFNNRYNEGLLIMWFCGLSTLYVGVSRMCKVTYCLQQTTSMIGRNIR